MVCVRLFACLITLLQNRHCFRQVPTRITTVPASSFLQSHAHAHTPCHTHTPLRTHAFCPTTQVLTHMTRKRPVDVNRVDFILQAEAFACLVKLDCVHAEGEQVCNAGYPDSGPVRTMAQRALPCPGPCLASSAWKCACVRACLHVCCVARLLRETNEVKLVNFLEIWTSYYTFLFFRA